MSKAAEGARDRAPGGIPEFALTNRVAIVTGGSRSLGRAAALALADAGADLVVAGRAMDDVEAVCCEIRRRGRRALACECDVTDDAAVDRLISRCLEDLGRIDILIANAGIFQEWKASEDLTLAEWDDVTRTDFRGVAACCLGAAER